MSAISEFSALVTESFDRIGKAVEGLTTDVADLKAKIKELQDSPGTITPEDQALLDAIQTKASAIADRVAALDAETPPVAPEG